MAKEHPIVYHVSKSANNNSSTDFEEEKIPRNLTSRLPLFFALFRKDNACSSVYYTA
jgi:hypothetical protein